MAESLARSDIDRHDPISKYLIKSFLIGDIVVGNSFLLDDKLAENLQRIVQDNLIEEIHMFLRVSFLQILRDDVKDRNIDGIALEGNFQPDANGLQGHAEDLGQDLCCDLVELFFGFD